MSADERKLIFSGQYYEAWRAQLISSIIANDALHDTISNEVSNVELQYITLPPAQFTEVHHEYLRKQEAAKSFVFNRLTLPIIETVRRCRTIREVMKKLDDAYRPHSFAIEGMARRNFYSLRYQDVNDMHVFLAKFENYADTLSDAGHHISEHERIQQLISAMTKEFDVTVLNYHMFAKEHGPSFQGLKRMLIDAYERDFDDKRLETLYSKTRRLNIESERDSTGRRTNATIVRTPRSQTQTDGEASGEKAAPKAERTETPRTQSRFDFQLPMTCHKCNGLGHKQAECPSQLKSNEHTKQTEETEQPKKADTKPAATYEERKARATAMMVSTAQFEDEHAPSTAVFMLDSGASNHMCANLREMNNVVALPEPVQITTASTNAPLVATHAGEMLIEVANRYNEGMEIILRDVFYVPNLPVNLLSENRITQSGRFAIHFLQDYADIVDTDTKEIAFTAVREGHAKFVRYKAISNRDSSTEHFACPTTAAPDAEPDQDDPTNSATEPETKDDAMALKWQWHRRLGHISGKYLRILARNSEELAKLNVSDNDFSSCRVCAMAKSGQLGQTSTRRKADRRFDIVSTDVLGPFTPGHGGEKYVVTFVDNFTNFVNIGLMKRKSEVAEMFARFHKQTEAKFPGTQLHLLRTDCAREYIEGDCRDYCKASGVTIEEPAPYAPQLNGVAERMNRTIAEKLRALLFDAELSPDYWPYAIQSAVYLINRSPTRANPNFVSPYEMWHGRKPTLGNIRIFGCVAERYIPAAIRNTTVARDRRAGKPADTKLCPRSERRILVGFTTTGYNVIEPETKKITASCDVRFDEARNIRTMHEQPEKLLPLPSADRIETTAAPTEKPAPVVPPIIDHPYAAFSLFASDSRHSKPLLEECVPTSFAEIANNPYAAQWRQAVATELTAMMRNNVFAAVTKLPNMKLVDSRWLFTIKYDRDGNPYAKARLVARGFRDSTVYYVNETYSPVVNLWLIRWAIALANKRGYLLTKYDVSTAFLNADLKTLIYLAVPEGMTPISGNTVLELKKSIYGLRPSSKNWYDLLHETILTLGFTRSKADRCLYFQTMSDQSVAVLLVYVDDMLLVTGDTQLIQRTTAALQECFAITVDENPKFFVGFEIQRDMKNKSIVLSQKNYVKRILRRFNLHDAYPQSTPMESGLKLVEPPDGKDDTEYRSMIGALLYVARGTRPDIAFAVNALSKAQTCSTEVEKNYVRRIFRYLAGTKDHGLVYNSPGNRLDAYVDASYAPNVTLPNPTLDLNKGKSISGYLLRVFEDPILWGVKKQTIVATSSTAAEVIALFDALDHLCVARSIMLEVCRLDEPVTVFEDNTSATRTVMGGQQTGMRSTLIKCYALLEAVEDREIKVENVPAKDQLADALTKPLDREKFLRFTNRIFFPETHLSN